MDNTYFNKALADFTNDVAYGAAVRKLAGQGCTVKEIKAKIDYPVSDSKIAEMVWKYYIDNGIIRLNKPEENTVTEKASYVLEYDAYGKPSYRRKVEQITAEEYEYFPCDFGKRLYLDRDAFMEEMSVLEKRDRDYICGLPWPLETVYHISNERMKRINVALVHL